MDGFKPGPKSYLRVVVQDDELQIRIGLETLKNAAEHCPDFQSEDCEDGPYESIVDLKELAADVKRALEDEEEDGTTPLHKLLDAAIVAARDDGSMAFAEKDDR